MDDVPPPGGRTPPPWQVLAALLQELPGLVSDRVHLLSLELKRAGLTLVRMIALLLGGAILLATAWLALWAAISVMLVSAGLGWGWAFAVVLLINLGAAAWALLQVKRLAPLLGLPATLRHLTLARSVPDGGEGNAPVSAASVPAAAAVAPSTVPVHG